MYAVAHMRTQVPGAERAEAGGGDGRQVRARQGVWQMPVFTVLRSC